MKDNINEFEIPYFMSNEYKEIVKAKKIAEENERLAKEDAMRIAKEKTQKKPLKLRKEVIVILAGIGIITSINTTCNIMLHNNKNVNVIANKPILITNNEKSLEQAPKAEVDALHMAINYNFLHKSDSNNAAKYLEKHYKDYLDTNGGMILDINNLKLADKIKVLNGTYGDTRIVASNFTLVNRTEANPTNEVIEALEAVIKAARKINFAKELDKDYVKFIYEALIKVSTHQLSENERDFIEQFIEQYKKYSQELNQKSK